MSPELDAVHRLIVECHREYFEESPSPAKVQKLCYYAQGYSLAEGQELFPEDFEAWQRGPVVPALHAAYRDRPWQAIETTWDLPLREPASAVLVREVVAAYGRYDGAGLSNMTHRESPWRDARGALPENVGCRAVISKASMRSFFRAELLHED
ncbi:type II toxin-antitoxin system antitoxin SocA domain-containing protein [Roseateles sp.]|jgi:uncharacterized phage-associated protein|uniref:Panacea domain-containing protein n=1 Tax=Roseateles sp. TaxID=1971397 RepID=UPI0031D8543C